MNKYQVAIFDFDGTLCNSVAAITASIKETFKHFGLQEPKDTHIETVISNGVGILDSLKLLNPSLMCSDDITVTNWIEAYRATTSKFEKPLYNNVSKVLRGLKESGISCIIVSNNTVENIGARRLHTIIERILDDISFTATDRAGEKIIINSEYVKENLDELVKDTDLSKFIL